MRQTIIVTACALAFLLAPAARSQMVPETNPKLAPAVNPKHPETGESLAARAQELTKKISLAKAQGKDTSIAEAEQTRAEKSMQAGNEREALAHFQAGEQALGMGGPQSQTVPSR